MCISHLPVTINDVIAGVIKMGGGGGVPEPLSMPSVVQCPILRGLNVTHRRITDYCNPNDMLYPSSHQVAEEIDKEQII